MADPLERVLGMPCITGRAVSHRVVMAMESIGKYLADSGNG